jgi:mono/diheme cytochrome c family protein
MSSGLFLGLGLTALLVPGAPSAGPPAERTTVAAVADMDSDSILVRWRTVDGTQRYINYDVLRRAADEADFVQLNDDPILPLETAAEIEAVFTAPGRDDALASIQEIFGVDYASDLLTLQGPEAPPEAPLQLRLLPEQNFAAALALGLGWLDETTTPGETYVYEVWGLDDPGARVERLGRATAIAGLFRPLAAPTSLACVENRSAQAHLVDALRWDESPAVAPLFGYDVMRVKRNPDLSCPMSGPDLAGAVRVNESPVLTDAAGRVAEGQALLAAHCSACHGAGRDDPLILGSGPQDFRRRQYPKTKTGPGCDDPATYPHNIESLNELKPEELRAIYDYIHEFQFLDDGSTVATEPLMAEETWCYQVAARDLLGQRGTPTPPVQCTVHDNVAPTAPARIKSARVASGGVESCEISWRRNAKPGDDTTQYRLYRLVKAPPRSACDDPEPDAWLAQIGQPVTGQRVTYLDALTAGDAGTPYFYAVRAEDASANLSRFSGWEPCVPRDKLPPDKSTLTVRCPQGCPEQQCKNWANDPDWNDGGLPGKTPFYVADLCDPTIDPGCNPCALELVVGGAPDSFKTRLYRSFDKSRFLSGKDYDPSLPIEPDFDPLVDSRICWKVRDYDKSGNLSEFSDFDDKLHCANFRGSQTLPPPRIISVNVTDAAAGEVKIRFRSLEAHLLLGFALYYKQLVPHEPVPPATVRGDSVESFPSQNLSASFMPDDIFQWVVKDGADGLDVVLPPVKPPAGPYLFYEGDRVYELVTNVPSTRHMRLWLAAIGWTGREGQGVPYLGSGLQLADGRLDWPEHSPLNPVLLVDDPDPYDTRLTVTPNLVDGYMSVEWTAWPSCALESCTRPCPAGQCRPFAVFRRREGAQTWQQISPLFVCPTCSLDDIVFRDEDVEEGFFYQYTVIRMTTDGEFILQQGPTTDVGATATCFGDCGGRPAPE